MKYKDLTAQDRDWIRRMGALETAAKYRVTIDTAVKWFALVVQEYT